jgi:hypothetical protein
MTTLRRGFDWTFRSRTTGHQTIVQLPNVPLGVFILAALARRAFSPTGTPRTVLAVIATGALVVWAADELIRGESPFRRALGAVVLLATIVGIFR